MAGKVHLSTEFSECVQTAVWGGDGAEPEVHPYRHGLLLHLPPAVPGNDDDDDDYDDYDDYDDDDDDDAGVQRGVLVERVQLAAGHLGQAHHAGQIQLQPGLIAIVRPASCLYSRAANDPSVFTFLVKSTYKRFFFFCKR